MSEQAVPGTTFQTILGAVLCDLRSKRESNGKPTTQSEMAEVVGVNSSTWSRIERGESPVSLEQLLRAANFLNVPLSEVFTETEKRAAKLRERGVHIEINKESLKNSGALPVGAAGLAALLGPATIAAAIGGLAYWYLNKDTKSSEE